MIAKVVKLEVCCVGLSICLCFPGKVCPYREKFLFFWLGSATSRAGEKLIQAQRLLGWLLDAVSFPTPRNHQKLGFYQSPSFVIQGTLYLKIKGHVIWACIVASDSRNFSHGLFPTSFGRPLL